MLRNRYTFMIALISVLLFAALVWNYHTSRESNNKKLNLNEPRYKSIRLIATLVAFYILSLIGLKKKWIGRSTFMAIWNIILLLSFLISGVLGILLAFRTDYEIRAPLPFSIVYWHAKVGIVMATVGLFHLHFNLDYYKRLLRL